jgi:hypothetical protein
LATSTARCFVTPTAGGIAPRDESKFPRPLPVDEHELEHPSVATIGKLVWNVLARLFHDPVGMLLGSAFLVIMLWGYHGRVDLLGEVWSGWKGPGSDPADRARIIHGIPWDQEWISFAAGCVLVVLIPCLLIKFVFKQPVRDYGLGLPGRDRIRLTLLSGAALFAVSLPAFVVAAGNDEMRATYPLFRGHFATTGSFLVFELGYLLFFVAIEFIFRGYLLLGLFRVTDRSVGLPGVTGESGPLVFGYYAVLISMLSYTAWHLGKPTPELWGTLIWGVAAGAVVLATGTIWMVVGVHWLLNVLLDLFLWKGWP